MKRFAASLAAAGLVLGLAAGPASAGKPVKAKVNGVASAQVHPGH